MEAGWWRQVGRGRVFGYNRNHVRVDLCDNWSVRD